MICKFITGPVADSKRGGGGGSRPLQPIGSHFCQKTDLSVLTAYISLCAFEINEDGADKLSSAPPFSKFLDPPLNGSAIVSSDTQTFSH